METGSIFWQESNNSQNRPEELSSQDNTTIPIAPSLILDYNAQNESIGKTEQINLRPTIQQIRYREAQREKNLLVGESRYMEPINEFRLISSVDVNTNKLVLPYREKISNNSGWLAIVLLLGLALFASVKKSFSNYIKYLIQSVFNYSTARRMFNEKNRSVSQASLRLEIFYYIVVSVFLYQLTIHYKIAFQFNKIYLFLICFGLLVAYYITKIALYRFVGSLTESRIETNEYLFNMSNFNRIIGIFLFPIVVFVAFSPFKNVEILIIAGGLLLLISYILLIWRGIKILLKKQFSIFYLFLYLCTLELLPLLLIYKLVIE